MMKSGTGNGVSTSCVCIAPHWAGSAAKFFLVIAIFLAGSLISACQTVPEIFRFGYFTPESGGTSRFELVQGDDVIGQVIAVEAREGVTLPDIARHFGLGYQEITRANRDIDVWQPGPGRRVVLPLQFILPDAPRQGIVLNLAAMRLFNFAENEATVLSYPAGIGREGWATPLVTTRVIGKSRAPNWIVPASIRREHAQKGDPLPAVVPPGVDNPLGAYAIRLGLSSYLIHGTNKPYGVGLRVSHGCVRLYPEHIEALYRQVAIGTPVRIVDQPYLLGWQGDMLYLEVHDWAGKPKKDKQHQINRLFEKLKKAARDAAVRIDWRIVENAVAAATGIPTPVLVEAPGQQAVIADAPVVHHPSSLFGMPVVPPLKAGQWSLQAGSFINESNAIQLAAILNHQGPPIPSRVIEGKNRYSVVAGPFENREHAQKISRRMQKEFEIDALLRKVD